MAENNPNSRLEAFCDGVFAIALTLLIIDIKIPSTAKVRNTADLWFALKNIVPSVLAFFLSFIIILIMWVNHHNNFKLVDKSSTGFLYANGVVLLTVVFIPFPTSLVGEYILTNHAAPAVVLYNAALAMQGMAWILVTGAALKHKLTKSENARAKMGVNRKHAYLAFMVYSLLAIGAVWFPLTVAIVTTLTLIFWLVFGIKMENE